MLHASDTGVRRDTAKTLILLDGGNAVIRVRESELPTLAIPSEWMANYEVIRVDRMSEASPAVVQVAAHIAHVLRQKGFLDLN